MNLYLVTQIENTGYDTFDSFVCTAPDEETARNTSPHGGPMNWDINLRWGSDWCRAAQYVTVKIIGITLDDDTEQHVICASFNAG